MRTVRLNHRQLVKLEKTLFKLSFGFGGAMSSYLFAAIKDPKKFVNVRAAIDDGKIIGWSIIHRVKFSSFKDVKFTIAVFVDPKYRRRGIGLHLLKMNTRDFKLRYPTEDLLHGSSGESSDSMWEKSGAKRVNFYGYSIR